jgi:hypothetical protein
MTFQLADRAIIVTSTSVVSSTNSPDRLGIVFPLAPRILPNETRVYLKPFAYRALGDPFDHDDFIFELI